MKISPLKRGLIVIVMLFCAASQTHGQELTRALGLVEDSRMKTNVQRAQKRFLESEKKASKIFVREILQREQGFKRNLAPAAAVPYLKQAADLRLWLASGGKFPMANEYLDITFRYAMSVAQARDALKKPVAALIKEVDKTNHAKATLLKKAFENSGRILDAKEVFKEKTKWRGHRQIDGSKGKTAILFGIESVAETHFSGRIAKNYSYSNHPVYELSGTIDGAQFTAVTGPKRAIAAGNDGQFTYQGFVFGRTIYGKFSGADSRGKRRMGTFRVDL